MHTYIHAYFERRPARHRESPRDFFYISLRRSRARHIRVVALGGPMRFLLYFRRLCARKFHAESAIFASEPVAPPVRRQQPARSEKKTSRLPVSSPRVYVEVESRKRRVCAASRRATTGLIDRATELIAKPKRLHAADYDARRVNCESFHERFNRMGLDGGRFERACSLRNVFSKRAFLKKRERVARSLARVLTFRRSYIFVPRARGGLNVKEVSRFKQRGALVCKEREKRSETSRVSRRHRAKCAERGRTSQA